MSVLAILACVSLIFLICKVCGAVSIPEPLNRWVTIVAAVILGLWVFHAELHIWIAQR